MKNYTLPGDFFSRETSKKNITVEKKLPETLTASTILLISFDVEYDGERDVSIIIDGVRNRLSGPWLLIQTTIIPSAICYPVTRSGFPGNHIFQGGL